MSSCKKVGGGLHESKHVLCLSDTHTQTYSHTLLLFINLKYLDILMQFYKLFIFFILFGY